MIWIIFLFFIINASGLAEYDNICTYTKPKPGICFKKGSQGLRAG